MSQNPDRDSPESRDRDAPAEREDPPGAPESRTGIPTRSLVWWAVLAVACCGVVATAHGLYEVAVACRVEPHVAALYVPITDGLALAAYASTKRLRTGGWYAWSVVVVAAGLSGLAQAVNLAGLGAPGYWLRFGVGYWPAVAVAIAAHLLWLVGRPNDRPTALDVSSASANDRTTEHHGSLDVPSPALAASNPPVQPASNGRPASNGSAKTAAGRAHAAALTLREPDGQWPTVEALARAANVSRGTAGTALRGLRR